MDKKFDKFDELSEKIEIAISEYANELRKCLVIPLCNKYKVSFHSGMGTFSFVDSNNDCIYQNDLTEGIYGKDLWEAQDFLTFSIKYMPYCIGSVIDSYKIS